MRILISWAVLALVLAGLVRCGGPGRVPTSVRLEADTDSTVGIFWSAPAEGTPDRYAVYFKALGETAYALVAETTENGCVHDPQGRTGRYRVSARFGVEEYDAATKPGTIPVHTDTIAVAELNATGNSGCGWDRKTGTARTFSMKNVGSREKVDFYVTDFKPAASNQLPYSIASPDMGPADLGGVVPVGSWRATSFTDPLSDENAPLPAYAPNYYFSYVDVYQTPCVVGCYTDDNRYSLIRVTAVNRANSWVQLETWFQAVAGLRLIQH
ncbi:hypothetical protein FJY69_03495 [candidate division WOR-3 bacterium]|nr:hypothetical protein [candidate division WOR-3 bacterium]